MRAYLLKYCLYCLFTASTYLSYYSLIEETPLLGQRVAEHWQLGSVITIVEQVARVIFMHLAFV